MRDIARALGVTTGTIKTLLFRHDAISASVSTPLPFLTGSHRHDLCSRPGLIDAGRFADYPRAHVEAAWQYMMNPGATCGPALEAAAALDGLSLPQPAALVELAAASPRASRRPSRRRPLVAPRPKLVVVVASTTRDWSAWATTLGGLAAGVVIVLSMVSEALVIDIVSPEVGGMTAGLVAIPSMTTHALVLAAGLGLYAAGLFAPLSRRTRS